MQLGMNAASCKGFLANFPSPRNGGIKRQSYHYSRCIGQYVPQGKYPAQQQSARRRQSKGVQPWRVNQPEKFDANGSQHRGSGDPSRFHSDPHRRQQKIDHRSPENRAAIFDDRERQMRLISKPPERETTGDGQGESGKQQYPSRHVTFSDFQTWSLTGKAGINL